MIMSQFDLQYTMDTLGPRSFFRFTTETPGGCGALYDVHHQSHHRLLLVPWSPWSGLMLETLMVSD